MAFFFALKNGEKTMRKIKRKKDNNKIKIEKSQFLEMLKKIYLAGTIKECIINFENGKVYSEAIDITNNIIVLAESETSINNPKYKMASDGFTGILGLGDIEILIKFLSSVDCDKINVTISESDNKATFSTDKGKRKMLYLLTIPELIPTRLRMEEDDENDYHSHFLDSTETVLQISQEEAKDLISYINLSASKLVKIGIKNDVATFVVGSGTEHRFSVSMDLDEDVEDYEIQINGKNFATILSSCVFSDENPTAINVGEEAEVVITDATTMWVLTIIEDDEEDNDDY